MNGKKFDLHNSEIDIEKVREDLSDAEKLLKKARLHIR